MGSSVHSLGAALEGCQIDTAEDRVLSHRGARLGCLVCRGAAAHARREIDRERRCAAGAGSGAGCALNVLHNAEAAERVAARRRGGRATAEMRAEAAKRVAARRQRAVATAEMRAEVAERVAVAYKQCARLAARSVAAPLRKQFENIAGECGCTQDMPGYTGEETGERGRQERTERWRQRTVVRSVRVVC